MKENRNEVNKLILHLTILILLLSSCNSHSKSNQGIQNMRSSSESVATENDTTSLLKYTSGIREIFEDSKGNIWIGSGNEGVCLYDGLSFTYFTKEDGLSHNQVRAVHEDENGLIWFECGFGLSYYDGDKITTVTKKDYSSRNDWQKSENDLWFKGDETYGYNELEKEPGIYRSHSGMVTYLAFPVPPHKYALQTYSVTTKTFTGKDGTLWFGHTHTHTHPSVHCCLAAPADCCFACTVA